MAVSKIFIALEAKLKIRSLIGRRKEIQDLQNIHEGTNSAFVAVNSRRNVGKVFLIRTAFDQHFAFQCTAIAKPNLSTQLSNFHFSLKQYYPGDALEQATDWLVAFKNLIHILKKHPVKRKVIFLDELPWMDTAQSGFIPALENFWNSGASA